MTSASARFFLALAASSGVFVLPACSDPESSELSACNTTAATAVALGDLLTTATVALDGDQAELHALVVSPDRQRVELGGARRLELVSEDGKTTVAATFAPDASCTSTYTAKTSKAALGSTVTLRLVDGAEVRSASISLAPTYAVSSAPKEIVAGTETGIALDRRFPSIVGSMTESWSVVLRGSCLKMAEHDEGGAPFTRAIGLGGDGSTQATGSVLNFQLPATELASGSAGCDVEAAFCSTLVGSLGGNMTGLGSASPLQTRSCTRFTTHVRS